MVKSSDSSLSDKIIQEQKRQELEATARKLKEAQQQRLDAAKQKIRDRGAAAKTKKYVIQAGDTLGKIAQQFYGDAGRWKEIAEANKDQIPNPDMIQVGQEIKIP